MNNFLILNSKDNVGVALSTIISGSVINIANSDSVTISQEIPQGHKFAIKEISAGKNVIKYGYPIGHAKKEIQPGEWVHTHNIETNLKGELSYKYEPISNRNQFHDEHRTFMGYQRENGKVGVRNDLYLIPTVGCINPLLDIIASQFKVLHPDNGNFDNIIILNHPYGCSQLGEDFEQTRKILVDAAIHPNVGGALILGLGCENNQMDGMKTAIKKMNMNDISRIRFLISQEVDDELALALSMLEELNDEAATDHRIPISLSKLNIGLKCGGSDGLSGVTANPLLGQLSDYIVAQGGSSLLTEVPEMFGAEKILMSRAKNHETFQKIVTLINDFKKYFEDFHQPIYENPSPGNKAGGISTLEDKSLGCTQKSGSSQVNDVLQYGDKIRVKGLSLLQSPGNDLVASSALASADCQIILFTTGRGTPFATYVPTVKVSSNSIIANKKKRWIDFDAGRLTSEKMDKVISDFVEMIIDTAGGQKTNNEKYGIYGLAIFKNGVTE